MKKGTIKDLHKNKRGAVLVEFAIAFMPLMITFSSFVQLQQMATARIVVKHATIVGSHVRTGSHNVFVAPVRIGDGAYTGAGTVVRKDVPAGSLAVNVAPQRNIEGWVATHRPGSAAADAAAVAGPESTD